MDMRKLKSLLKKIDKRKKLIGIHRDKIIEVYYEISTLADDLDNGIYHIEKGLKDIELGIDEISQNV